MHRARTERNRLPAQHRRTRARAARRAQAHAQGPRVRLRRLGALPCAARIRAGQYFGAAAAAGGACARHRRRRPGARVGRGHGGSRAPARGAGGPARRGQVLHRHAARRRRECALHRTGPPGGKGSRHQPGRDLLDLRPGRLPALRTAGPGARAEAERARGDRHRREPGERTRKPIANCSLRASRSGSRRLPRSTCSA